MGTCKYKRGEYCGLRNDIRATHLKIKSYCIQGPCPDEKPRTNADNIRQASDEELAALLQNSCCKPDLIDCPQIDDCVDCWLDWLKQEVSND